MTIHTLSPEEHDELLKLRAWKQRQEQQAALRLRFKVSTKGAVSVYGMGKWPVTLYQSQWEALFKVIPALQDFIKDNSDQLSSKSE